MLTTNWLHTVCLGKEGRPQVSIRGFFWAEQRTAVREAREGHVHAVWDSASKSAGLGAGNAIT